MAVAFTGVRLQTNAANVTLVDYQNLFGLGSHRNRSNQSCGGWDRGVACKDKEMLASCVVPIFPNQMSLTHSILVFTTRFSKS